MPGVFWNGNSSTNSVFGSMYFSLSGVQLNYSAGSPCFSQAGFKSMPSYTEFTNLYDKYSIRKVVIKWRPRANVTQGLGNSYVNSLYYNIVKDYDDDATTFSQDDLLQRQNVKYKSVLRNSTTILVPAANQVFYNSTLTVGYGQRFKPWIDSSSPDIPHYGIKFFAPGTASSSDVGFKMDISVTIYFAFKQVK